MRNPDPEELRDMAIAEAARRHAAAMRTNVLTGHQQSLSGLANSMAHRLTQHEVVDGVKSEFDVLADLIRTALSCGVHTAGNRLLDLIDLCIADDAENEAIKEIERLEAGVTSKDRQRIGAMQAQREVAAAYGSAVSV